jgi:hypothetical protein
LVPRGRRVGAQLANLKALIYFDKIKDGWPWNSDSSTESLAGYRDMAASRSVRAMPQLR